MASEKLSLGIDTSNYKTSVAITSENGEIIFNEQNFLNVNRGERGLRQPPPFNLFDRFLFD